MPGVVQLEDERRGTPNERRRNVEGKPRERFWRGSSTGTLSTRERFRQGTLSARQRFRRESAARTLLTGERFRQESAARTLLTGELFRQESALDRERFWAEQHFSAAVPDCQETRL